jgi:hypothetical protein
VILQLDAGSKGISPAGGVYYNRHKLGTPQGVQLGHLLAP